MIQHAAQSGSDDAAAALALLADGIDPVTRAGAPQIVERSASGGTNEILAMLARERGKTRGSVSNPMEQVVAFFRCVQFLAESVAYLPLCVSTQDDRLVESGPIADLLDQPNERMGREQFIHDTIGWALTTDAAYWIFTQRSGTRPTEILPAGGLQVRPRYARRDRQVGEPIGWLYRPAGMTWEQAIPLELDEVWQIKISAFDPDRPARGLAIADVVRKAMDQVYKSDLANTASLDNGVEPGGVFSMEGQPTPEQAADVRQELETRQGASERRRPLLLWGGLKWQQTAANFKDMEFSDLKKFSRADVCAAFGLDPSAVGFPPEGGRFEYAAAAEDKAWISRVLPLAKRIAGHIDRAILSHYETDASQAMARSLRAASPTPLRRRIFAQRAAHVQRGRRLYAWFDGSVVEPLKELIATRTETAAKMVRDLKAAPADAIALMDIGLEVHPWQEVGWRSATEVAITDADYLAEPGDQDPPADPGSEDELEKTHPLRQVRSMLAQQQAGGAKLPTATLSQSDREALWLSWRSLFSGVEPAFRSRYRRHMMGLRDEVLRKLERYQGGDKPAAESQTERIELEWLDDDGQPQRQVLALAIEQRELLGEILFDLAAANTKLRASVMPLVRGAMQSGGEAIMQEAAEAAGSPEPDPFNLADPEAAAALKRRELSITDLNRRTQQRLRAELARALQQGVRMGELQDTIRSRFKVEANKAKTIAYQELGTSVEESRHAARKQAGVPLKSWLWSHKETGRPLHAATEAYYSANPVALEKPFVLGGPTGSAIRCMHPRATGRADQDINCGCTTLSRYPGDTLKSAAARMTRSIEHTVRGATDE